MRLKRLRSAVMGLIFTGIFCVGLTSLCLADGDGVGGVDFAIWRNRPVEANQPRRDEAKAEASQGTPDRTAPLEPSIQSSPGSRSSSARQENGCPQSSGLGSDKWVCLTLPEAALLDSRLIDLYAALAAERAKRPKHLGLTVACSSGAAIGLDGKFGLVPPSCGIYYGFAFRLGK